MIHCSITVSGKYIGLLYGVVVLTHLLPNCKAHGNGAPESRCGTMVPGHWVGAQTTPCPFQIQISSDTVQEGDILHVNLTGSTDQQGFKGFLAQVKQAGGQDSLNFGSFDPFKSDIFQSQPLDCFGVKNSAMTHKDPVEKHFVYLVWIAPALQDGNDGVYEIRVTFVQNFWTIWPNQSPGKLIRVTKREITHSTEDNIGDANPLKNTPLSTPLPPAPAHNSMRPVSILVPQLRDAESVYFPCLFD